MDTSGGYIDHPFVSEFYDAVVPYRERKDVEFYVEMAREVGGPVLEIGCGTGRVLLPVARQGLLVMGVDYSDLMLDRCRAKLAEEPEEVRHHVELARADLRTLDLWRMFKLVMVPFRVFQHLLSVDDQLAALRNIRRHLSPEGVLVFDVFNPSIPGLVDDSRLEESSGEEPFTMGDGRVVTRKHRIASRDYFNQVSDVELIYYVDHPDGRQERLVHSFPMRYYFRYELEHLLVRSGFEVEQIYGDFDRSPYGSTYPGELIVVARRVEENH